MLMNAFINRNSGGLFHIYRISNLLTERFIFVFMLYLLEIQDPIHSLKDPLLESAERNNIVKSFSLANRL